MNGKINFTPKINQNIFKPNLKQAEKFFSKQELTGSVLGQKMPNGRGAIPTDPSTVTGYGRTK